MGRAGVIHCPVGNCQGTSTGIITGYIQYASCTGENDLCIGQGPAWVNVDVAVNGHRACTEGNLGYSGSSSLSKVQVAADSQRPGAYIQGFGGAVITV